jgi:protein O-mannosyl-transferase
MTSAPRKPLFSSNYQFDLLLCLGLVLAIFLPYQQVAGHRFVEFDDGMYAFYNTYVIKGLSWDSVQWAFTNTDSANWQPLTWISHLLDRELFGPFPGGYLLENVAWHSLAACLCYFAFLRTTRSRLFAFIVALIFAVHPVNVENVAWLSERKSLLNAVFWFCAIISYLDFLQTRSLRAYGFTAIAFLLSLMSKPMSVTLPCTLALIHLLYLVYQSDLRQAPRLTRSLLRQVIRPLIPLLAISIYFCGVTVWAQSVAMPEAGKYPFPDRLLNVVDSYGRYLAMFFHPTKLAIFYPLFHEQLSLRASAPTLLLLLAITLVILLSARWKPQLLIGWCWFIGTMVPAVGFVQVGSQSHADRYLYIPMLGLAFLYPVLLEGLRSMGRTFQRMTAGLMLGVLGVSMIIATGIQVSYWKDGVTLFLHALDVSGDCVTSVVNLAVAYERTGRMNDVIAFVDLKMPVATNPMNKGRLAAIKATALHNLQKYEAAITSAKEAVAWGDTGGSAYWTMAACNFELGRLDEAAECLAKARAIQQPVDPTNYVHVQRDAGMKRLEQFLKEHPKASIPGQPGASTVPLSPPKAKSNQQTGN